MPLAQITKYILGLQSFHDFFQTNIISKAVDPVSAADT